jgi:hypothetical protein
MQDNITVLHSGCSGELRLVAPRGRFMMDHCFHIRFVFVLVMSLVGTVAIDWCRVSLMGGMFEVKLCESPGRAAF